MIILVRVIPNTEEKSLILPGFSISYLDENILNNMIIDFF
jgi:hypothetical protein